MTWDGLLRGIPGGQTGGVFCLAYLVFCLSLIPTRSAVVKGTSLPQRRKQQSHPIPCHPHVPRLQHPKLASIDHPIPRSQSHPRPGAVPEQAKHGNEVKGSPRPKCCPRAGPRHGMAWHGMAWRGAWHGLARRRGVSAEFSESEAVACLYHAMTSFLAPRLVIRRAESIVYCMCR